MNDRNYHRARRRVRRRKGFYYHLSIYFAVGLFLFFINVFTDPNFLWFPIPLSAWALLLFSHYLIAVGIPFFNLGSEWEERAIDREMRKMQAPENPPISAPPYKDEELELKEFQELRREWDDQEFV